ncbi:MAG: hypothetical protein H6681_03735 [Desulfobacteraceae bacterium]|nr:hypothetical protein [Desulfobacteraceae bacterium]
MNRSKKIVVLCHCILNSNAKVTPLATYQGVLTEAVRDFIEKGYGIIQLPCPESTYLGMNRWGMSKDQYDHPSYRAHCQKLIKPYADQLETFAKADYKIHAVIGVNGSPSCGVSLTPVGLKGGVTDPGENPFEKIEYINQSGVFIEELKEILTKRGIAVKFMAIDEKNPSEIKEV